WSVVFLLVAFSLSVFAQSGTEQTSATRRRLVSERSTGAENQSPTDWRVVGPAGGDVRALVVDPKDASRFYLGTLDGQLYTSTDGAQTWSRLPAFDKPTLYIDHIIVDPRDSKIIYVAAHRHKRPGGFFKSTDGGQTWRDAKELKNEALHSLTQSSKKPELLLAGTNSGIFRSDDGGDSWKALPTSQVVGLVNVESLAIDPRNADVIYAGTWYLPYKSTDGGQTWKSIKTGMIDDSDVFAIDIDPRNPNHVIASACSGIYDSQDMGETWRKVQGIPSSSRRTRAILQHPSSAGVIFAGTTEGFWRSTSGGNSWDIMTSKQLEINSIAVHPENPQNVYIGTNNYGVMISHDGGKTFAPSNSGFSARRAYFILPDREQTGRMYLATINTATGGGFFYLSTDGGETWQPSMRNMPSRLISYSVTQDRLDANKLYIASNMGLYRSLDRGASWEAIGAPKQPAKRGKGKKGDAGSETKATSPIVTAPTPAEEAALRALVKSAQEALAAAGYDVGRPDGAAGPRTVAALRQFQASKGVPQTGKLDNPTLTALGLGGGNQLPGAAGAAKNAPIALTETVNAIDHSFDEKDGQNGFFAATAAGLYRTSDPLKGWERIDYGGSFDARTLCVSTMAENPKTIWVGTASSGVLVSRDGGETWKHIEAIPSAAPVNVIRQDSQRSDYVYVGTGWSLYLSRDGGENWDRRGGDLPYGNFTSLLINPENHDEVFTGSAFENGGGVFHSIDAGQTWKRVDPELPSRRVWALAFGLNDTSKVFVGSHSAGIYIAGRNGTRHNSTSALEK
ncbi:MAG TPA: YCF48-related protein, partial [Pyrinomonadaceae bacterium]|nr:YCF48-related protein [Pyrinomonadaceae bacterium]